MDDEAGWMKALRFGAILPARALLFFAVCIVVIAASAVTGLSGGDN